MKKTIITLVALGAVVGGGFLYKASRDAKNNPIITIQGVDTMGVQQKVVFTNEGCTFTEGQGKTMSGIANSQDLQNLCRPAQGTNLSQAQFECAVSLCKKPITANNQLKTGTGCSNPTVGYSIENQSCTVENCVTQDGTDISGSYQMSQEQYLNSLNSWGMDSKGLAFTCGGVPITDTSGQEQSALGKTEVPTQNTGANTSTQKAQTRTTSR